MSILFGTPVANKLSGTIQADLIAGGYGNDSITSGGGNDVVIGGFGDDQITVSGPSHSHIDGGAGLDTVKLAAGAWAIQPPGYGNFGFLYDLSTGQGVAISDVEQVQLGASVVKFATGSDLADTVNGTNNIDYIRGLDGNDKISTLDGNDWVSSGNGADTVSTGNGNDIIDDRVQVRGAEFQPPPVNNVFNLGAGNDAVLLNLNFDFLSGAPAESFKIDGGIGSDVVYLDGFSLGQVTVNAGGDIITKGFLGGSSTYADLTGIEQIVSLGDNQVWTVKNGVATEGRPMVHAGAGTLLSEDLHGTAANNVLTGNGGYDRYFGGAGSDTVVLSGRAEQVTAGDFLNLVSVQDKVTGVVLHSEDPGQLVTFVANDIETLKFLNGPGAADDASFNFKIVTTTAVAPAATAGNDFAIIDPGNLAIASVKSLAGDDYIFGEGKIGTVDGGAGDDHLSWSLASTKGNFIGGIGNDELMVLQAVNSTSATLVTVDGGAGNDTLSVFGTQLTVKAMGGDGDDVLSIGAGGTADGGAGNDQFSLGFLTLDDTQSATVTGGAGDDFMDVQGLLTDYAISKTATGLLLTAKSSGATVNASGIEAITSDEAQVRFSDIQSANVLNLDAAANTVNGGAGIDVVSANAGNDKLNGNNGHDILAGDAGNDVMTGGAGEDNLAGGIGNDAMRGDAGNDIIVGGAGNDTQIGGLNQDQFWFDYTQTNDDGSPASQGADRITDFQGSAGDVIVIRSVDDQINSFADALAAATQVGANTVLNFGAYGSITLANVQKASLASDDFVFLI